MKRLLFPCVSIILFFISCDNKEDVVDLSVNQKIDKALIEGGYMKSYNFREYTEVYDGLEDIELYKAYKGYVLRDQKRLNDAISKGEDGEMERMNLMSTQKFLKKIEDGYTQPLYTVLLDFKIPPNVEKTQKVFLNNHFIILGNIDVK